MYMRILPKSRYGQFSAADAMVRSLAMTIGVLLLGILLDQVAVYYPTKDYCSRFIPIWSLVFLVGSLFFSLSCTS